MIHIYVAQYTVYILKIDEWALFVRIEPSKVCGPFRGEEKAYSIVTNLIDSWKGDLKVLRDIINFISSPGSIASILVALW